MSTAQKNLFVVGILLVSLFVFIQPIRYQSIAHIPIIESVSKFQPAPLETLPLGSDHRKNMIAALLTGAATVLGIYCLKEQHPVLNH